MFPIVIVVVAKQAFVSKSDTILLPLLYGCVTYADHFDGCNMIILVTAIKQVISILVMVTLHITQ